ncbi:mitogen-activated protein kinase kinase kinase A-like [Paramacrobiotus metropolitanus]|uniref:mitogen-activated protein kinase kinase kinase A-like n=1 Tax=Paramacrobiotus metropolitanus TaxID=2943436 RepID=UPI002445BFB4|nr:mitogen-activated protein kinase kinase kinase A-like [Paramacrobiotus metropolitanus]
MSTSHCSQLISSIVQTGSANRYPRASNSTNSASVSADNRKHLDYMDAIGQLHPGFTCNITPILLGRGGQSPRGVYVGVDSATNKQYAIKLLNADDAGCVQDTVEEVRRIQAVEHRNLVKYYGIDLNVQVQGSRELWLIMELCQGNTLRSLAIQSHGLDYAKVLDITQQILSGLEYLHLHHIVHRDLKGQNILVGMNGAIKLADFGLSRTLLGTRTRTMEIEADEGTWRYMAPEAMTGPKIGRSSDMWSMGCVLVEMVTGEAPKYKLCPDTGKELIVLTAQAGIHIGHHGNGPLFPLDKLSARYSQYSLGILHSIFRQCIVTVPSNRATAKTLLQFVNNIIDTPVPALPEAEVSWMLAACKIAASRSFSSTTSQASATIVESDGPGSLSRLCRSVQALLTDARVMGNNPFTLTKPAKFRWLPFEHSRYIMVDTANIVPKRFIIQFLSGKLRGTAGRGAAALYGVLLETPDPELEQFQRNSRSALQTGTLETLKGHSYATLIVFPNGAARRDDMWTSKSQLDHVFSIAAEQLIIVGQLSSKEILGRSRWKELLEDATSAERLIRAPN